MKLTRTIRNLMIAGVTGLMVLASPNGAMAEDTLHLKDGRVLEGTIVKEGDGYIFFKYSIGSIEKTELFPSGDIDKLVRDEPADAGTPGVDSDPSEPTTDLNSPDSDDDVTKIAILNFGAPSDWHGEVGNTVGIQINAQAWRDAAPMLEADGVDVVVVRINSGGGYLLELEKFHEVFEEEYKPRFRTVTWIESAISAAAMSPWVLEEMYFLPEGNIGACTGWSGNLQAVAGFQLEVVLLQMERASDKAGRDHKIMRAMQIQEPLSVDIDEATGRVTWRQDEDGEHVLNPAGEVYTMNAVEGVLTKFASGVASTPEELAEVLGYTEYEFAGKKATDFIDENMRITDRFEKRLNEVFRKYGFAIQLAQGQPRGSKERGAQVARAKRFLAQIRRWVQSNPNFVLLYGMNDEWFREQEEFLKDLVRTQ